MQSTSTVDPDSPRSRRRTASWALNVALDCAHLDARPLRLSLDGVTEVEIGRGEARAVVRSGSRLRLELPDSRASQVHAHLTSGEGGWTLSDAGSKNGTHVNQRPVERALLADGDVIECGGTFLVMRRGEGPIRDLGPDDQVGTLSLILERELASLPKIARSPLPILVRGESGTGKEVMAGAIHSLSQRSGPMVAVNCGAIPATLIESELFGSRRGAFSGAEDRLGLVRSAEHGTLFLDEVAELPLASQVALLRLLQEREVLPLGGSKPMVVDVRVIAATHQPLEELIGGGRFRRDLFARLRAYELRLPELRARIEDLGILIRDLLARIEPGAAPRTLSRAAARALFAHGWPFQVRELEQALRATVAVSGPGEIGVSDLRLSTLPPAGDPVRERLVAALSQHHGNLSAVARALVTSRTHVQRLIERYGLSREDFKRRG